MPVKHNKTSIPYFLNLHQEMREEPYDGEEKIEEITGKITNITMDHIDSYFKNLKDEQKSSFIKKNVYDYLRIYEGDFKTLLSKKKINDEFEIQENVLWIFSFLNIIKKFEDYEYCSGKYSEGTFEKITDINIRNFFKTCCVRIGDKADLILKHKTKKELIVCSSKNINNAKEDKLDIQDLILCNMKEEDSTKNSKRKKYVERFEGFDVKLCIIIPNKKSIDKILKSKAKSDSVLISELQTIKNNNLIIDYDDLSEYFIDFKEKFKEVDSEQVIKDYFFTKPAIKMRPHGVYSITKTMDLLRNKVKSILWAHICRSGKSYIMAGLIDEFIVKNCVDEKKIVLIITTSPSNTISQYMQVFCEYSNFADCNVCLIENEHSKGINPIIDGKVNIFIVSKQYFHDKKEESLTWLKKVDLRFIDESHYGGCTDLSEKTFNTYGKNSPTIFMTATFSKPVQVYGIPIEHTVYWDMDDVKLCKNFNEENRRIIVEKYGKDYMKAFEDTYEEEVRQIYSSFPDLHILTLSMKGNIKEILQTDPYYDGQGFTATALMVPCNTDGFEQKFKLSDTEERMLENYLKMIEAKFEETQEMSRETGSRLYTRENKLIQLWFIPGGTVGMLFKDVSFCLKKYMEKKGIFSNFHIASICECDDAFTEINDARNIAYNEGKIGTIVLAGDKLKLGASLSFCDIVVLLNNSRNFDDIMQRIFRSLTESASNEEFKKNAYCIDLDLSRVVKTVVNMANVIYPKFTSRQRVETLFERRIIGLNWKEWEKAWNSEVKSGEYVEEIYQAIYEAYKNYFPFENIKNAVKKLKLTKELFSEEEWNNMKRLLININCERNEEVNGSINNPDIEQLNGSETGLSSGISVKKKGKKTGIILQSEEIDDDRENMNRFENVLQVFIPLLALLSIESEVDDLEQMYNFIRRDEYLNIILIKQLQIIWKKETEQIKIILDNLIDTMRQKQIREIIEMSKVIKEGFINSKNKKEDLSKLIDIYLPATSNEKKSHAEFATPFVLRNDMLNLIPDSFWKNPNVKVFEPCAGKGQFVIDIIKRFMDGLKNFNKKIDGVKVDLTDNEKRYKYILQNIIYFADINQTNIFIIKLLLDPNKKYERIINSHCNLGDTLSESFSPEKTFGIKGFDAVIGNPPYNTSGETDSGNTLYQEFIRRSLNNWILQNGYLLFVTPPAWRKPNTESSRNFGMYDLMAKDNQMLTLEIHNEKDGMKIFNAGTKYDFYLIKKCKPTEDTTVIDQFGKKSKINLTKLDWLPNNDFDKIMKALAKNDNERMNILFTYEFEPRKPHMSETKDSIHKYPCVHSTPESGITLRYSSKKNDSLMKTKKVIAGLSSFGSAFYDNEGKYCMTQNAFAIVDTEKAMKKIADFLRSDKMKELKSALSWGNYFEWRVFLYFKKDFYKYF